METSFTKGGKPGHKGIKRIVLAGQYSLSGLRSAWSKELAFRQEVVLAIPAILLIVLLDFSPLEKAMLWASTLLVLIVELINSAIEATVDRIGEDHHPLSGCAKDMGSAAVLISLLLMLGVWSCLLF